MISGKVVLTVLFLIFSIQPGLSAVQQSSSTQQSSSSLVIITEDWNSLSVESSHLQSFPPIIGESDVHADFTRELVRVEWRPNDPIYLYVIRPKQVHRP